MNVERTEKKIAREKRKERELTTIVASRRNASPLRNDRARLSLRRRGKERMEKKSMSDQTRVKRLRDRCERREGAEDGHKTIAKKRNERSLWVEQET